MAIPSNHPAVPAKPQPVDGSELLELALRLGAAHDGTAVSTRHLALAELIVAYRALPPNAMVLLPPAVTPKTYISATVGDAHYELSPVDDTLTITIHDAHGDHTTIALTAVEARSFLRDIAAVLATVEGRVR